MIEHASFSWNWRFFKYGKPGNYVEALKQNKDPNSPVKSVFGTRLIAWDLMMNLSSDFGVSSDYERELRQLFRNVEFRKAISHAMDRDTMGQSVARGLFPSTCWWFCSWFTIS